jgi:hypothetical protein
MPCRNGNADPSQRRDAHRSRRGASAQGAVAGTPGTEICTVLPAAVRIVDSAGTTAAAVVAQLDAGQGDSLGGGPPGRIKLLATGRLGETTQRS